MQPQGFSRVAVVGSGAIGTYCGARLALAGNPVAFLMRSDLAAVKARGSVILHLPDGTHEVRPARVYGAPEEIGAVDLVVIGLKTTANRELLRLLPPLLGPGTALLTLQNGLGTDEFLADNFGPERVYGALAFVASNRVGAGEVRCFHPGYLAVGEFRSPPTPRLGRIAGELSRAGIEVHTLPNLLEARWRKLVWNVPFNGLSVAHNVTTDQLCTVPELTAEVHALMREIQGAAAAIGIRIPDEFLAEQFGVTPAMGAYQPSSLVDFRAGREVEVESIWGEPLRRARAAGVAMPRLEALYNRLRQVTGS